MLNRFHSLIGMTDWLDGKERVSDEDCDRLAQWAQPYENYWHRHDDPEYLRELDPDTMCFGECIDQMSGVAERVAAVTERRKGYVHAHTGILDKALRWHKNQRANRFLLTGKERRAAEDWLHTEFHPPNQPPCKPSNLHCDFICESRKNAENMMTDSFICYDAEDRPIRDKVIRSLSLYGITVWTHDRDIKKGAEYERAIEEGIENADNFLYFISPRSAASEYCRKELDHAVRFNKRIVPLLIDPTPEDIPGTVRGLQYTDFTDNEEKAIYDGIEKSDNFLFVISPDAVESEYCGGEVNYAAELSKRFITLLHRETEPGKMPVLMQKINWIDFQQSSFDQAFPELIQALELDREHARMHTVLQQRASEWADTDRNEELLMNKTACERSETWVEKAAGYMTKFGKFGTEVRREII